jgi:Flp pilus assembly pilin Flp
MQSSASSCYGLSATRKPRTRPIVRLIRIVTGIKYGLLGTLIAVAAVIMMGTVGTDLVSTFGSFDSNLVVPSPAPMQGTGISARARQPLSRATRRAGA